MPSRGKIQLGVVVALAASLSAGGVACGGSEPDAEAEIAAALREIQAVFDAGDVRGVCGRVSGVAACRRTVTLLAARAHSAGGARRTRRVLDAKLTGDHAIAKVALNPKVPGRVGLVKEGGEWKLADLTVTPWRARSRWSATDTGEDWIAITRRRGARRIGCSSLTGVRRSSHDAVRGGCPLRIGSKAASVSLLTVFGDVEIARCKAGYVMNYAPNTTTVLIDQVEFRGRGICADVAPCKDGETGLRYPWQGGKVHGPFTSAVLMRFDICLNTPLGRARGMMYSRLAKRAGDWTMDPVDYPIGESSVRIGGRWDLRPDDLSVSPRTSGF